MRIVSAGSSRWVAGHEFRRRSSEVFGLECVTSGSARFVQDGREYMVIPGEVFILRKGCAHVYGTAGSGFLHKRFLTMEGSALEPLIHASGLAGCDYVRPRAPRTVAHLMRAAKQLLQTKPKDFVPTLSAIGYRLLVELGRSATPPFPAPVRAAVEFIQQNLHRPLSSSEISNQAGTSSTHLNRLFRRHLGTSPVNYAIDQRMAWARHLLSVTALSVKEVAATVGYDDPLYFSSQFRKRASLSPREFRRRRAAERAR